jgi:hypothetical protein
MKVVLAALGLLACAGCVRAAEGVVRVQAASAFACADYALHVEEVGPDVYRASGCGQERIYACRPRALAPPQDGEDFGDEPSRTVVCSRQPE